jgi:hypothetical protein
MTSVTNTISKLAVTVGVAAMLALGTITPSLADSNDGGPFYYEPSDNGSVWSNYPGYTSKRTVQPPAHDEPAYRARAQVPGFGNNGGTLIDNPPGSAYQSLHESEDDVGCPC